MKPLLLTFALLIVNVSIVYPLDLAKQFRQWENSAEQGEASAQYNLGLAYYTGLGVEQDYETANQWFVSAAEQGHAYAQYSLGMSYLDGNGIIKDFVLAYMWLDIAANNKMEDAIFAKQIIFEIMTPSEKSKAQQKVKDCLEKKFKGC